MAFFLHFIRISQLTFWPSMLPDGTTKMEYIDLLVSTIEMHNKDYGDRMLVRLLISIDRSKSVEENEETVELVLGVRTRSELVVGIDLSGNPLKGSFVDFLPLLEKCRNMGMFVTVHTAEVPDKKPLRNEVKNICESVAESDREGRQSSLMTETDSILHFW
jgi:Adenosine deaminase